MPTASRTFPGSLDVWRTLFVEHPSGSGKYDSKLSQAAGSWKDPDDVIEALFGLCRKAVENEPLKIFMALSDVDRHRQTPLDPKTADRLAREFRSFGAQYPIFAEVSDVSNEHHQSIPGHRGQALTRSTILRYARTRPERCRRWSGCGRFFAGQNSIAPADRDRPLASILTRFTKVKNESDVFDGGREGVQTLLAATNSPAGVSAQDRMLDLLAGTAQPDTSDAHNQLVEDMIRIFEAQRLISLTSTFRSGRSSGESGQRREGEQRAHHQDSGADLRDSASAQFVERRGKQLLKLRLLVGEAHRGGTKAESAGVHRSRGLPIPRSWTRFAVLMAPFLRDTLIGFNYVHYAPPGAQVLYTNPLFVRSHDFVGLQGANGTWKETEVLGSGWPSSAGGKLVGSLVSLPYALAEAEQNFLIPSREQALIWGDLVPQLLLTATVPRWWNVTPAQLHWVALHMDYGETLLAEVRVERRTAGR